MEILNSAHNDDLIKVARRLTSHLSRPKRTVYWFDFLSTHSLGCVAFYFTTALRTPYSLLALSFTACILLWYRSLVFIHEVVHLRQRRMRVFGCCWNLLAGIPLLTPSFLYSIHLDHHSRTIYGSSNDGEYIPWGIKAPGHILLFAMLSLGAPVLAIVRFLVVTPFCWIAPRSRSWIEEHASSMVINPRYRRQPKAQERICWRSQETCTFLWISSVAVVVLSGLLPWRWPATALVVLMLISFINSVRTMASHRFVNAGQCLTHLDQVRDSVNHPAGGLLTELWCPVGLRFHALHHMLPFLPYHALPEAHRILMRALPADSLYRSTNSSGLAATLRTLWLNKRSAKLTSSGLHQNSAVPKMG